ncbi:D-alanyl-D-alanine carboxypeptidase/D-alanyl-D-alanine endopeptidase [Virgibacillus halodenitrificans]|uniref:D-alanyl-D-alanine carboxypeptidase/D-alanyl-D-alanine endopeptidase n=1 Tax=Virgibacillus halodenitrificans TaxID=1482 RepID=UPI002DB84744|nr:D-alanyl-D-alanine carboxypeptidase/D-alanyl-D-alanine-endopeptidase [Virgibacillus halodenitrificans]MEC2158265.1 D-alanyl-D-alanine carboxypeptidase/D-alanyl-D-alanine-endopeptidase [Virgibacillus halodenitrificans]
MIFGKKMRNILFMVSIAVLICIPFVIQERTSNVVASDQIAKVEAKQPNEKVTMTATELQEKLDAILSKSQLQGTSTGISIRNANDGELLYNHSGEMRLHPASNQKILTAVAALSTLGEDHRFTTQVLTDGKLKGKVLRGNLYLKGKGDPTLLKEDLDHFAKQLKEQGIHKIKGNIVGDDTWFDDVRLATDINWDDESNYTAAQISALTLSPNEDYDSGTVIVQVLPGEKAGDKPKVVLSPQTDYITINNEAKTTAKETSKQISVQRDHGTNTITISGNLPLDSSSKSWVAVWEPTRYVVDVFKQSLEEQGITMIGNSEAAVGKTPKDAEILTKKDSMPLKELLVPFLKLSNNGHGEILVKEMGQVIKKEGSWDKGLDVVEDVLINNDLAMDTIRLRDGAGMSHKNLLPANQLSKLLFEIQDESWFPEFKNALPVAGEPERLVGGTLRYRLTGDATKGKVHAKTGSLTGVNTLSGYVTNKDGEKLIFSIMMNNYIQGSMPQIQDAIVTALAEHSFEE